MAKTKLLSAALLVLLAVTGTALAQWSFTESSDPFQVTEAPEPEFEIEVEVEDDDGFHIGQNVTVEVKVKTEDDVLVNATILVVIEKQDGNWTVYETLFDEVVTVGHEDPDIFEMEFIWVPTEEGTYRATVTVSEVV
ncbi:MAG: hypothetical protein ACE5KH_00605 [Candidatus Geothermarchaeales archaeon]